MIYEQQLPNYPPKVLLWWSFNKEDCRKSCNLTSSEPINHVSSLFCAPASIEAMTVPLSVPSHCSLLLVFLKLTSSSISFRPHTLLFLNVLILELWVRLPAMRNLLLDAD